MFYFLCAVFVSCFFFFLESMLWREMELGVISSVFLGGLGLSLGLVILRVVFL